MTDEQTLLAAILARPLDDLPRLVYADWLEETAGIVPCSIHTHGNPAGPRDHFQECGICHGTGEVSNSHAERAEFIRVQCELAIGGGKCDCGGQAEAVCATTKWSERYDALRRREQQLMDAALLTWNNFPSWVSEWWFVRGFVEMIRCSWSDFRTHADAIRKATPLRKVRTDMPDDERRKCWTFNPPHAETFLRHPDYKGIEFELMSQEGGTLVTFNIPVRNPRHFFVMRAE